MRGMSIIELLVVMGILGILAMVSAPSILNVMEERSLDQAAGDVLTSFQNARYLAISTKLRHRVIFKNPTGAWQVEIEREAAPGTWTRLPGSVPKILSKRIIVTLNIPTTQFVVFSAIGFIANYDPALNSLTLDSPKLKALHQPDRRLVQIFAGGSIRYSRSST